MRMNRLFPIGPAAIACLSILPALAAPDVARADDSDDGDLVVLDGGFAQVSLIGLLQTQLVPWQGDDALIVSGDPADAPGARLQACAARREGLGLG